MPWILVLADQGLDGDVAAPTRLRARMLHAAYARDRLCDPPSTRPVGERVVPADAADAARGTGRLPPLRDAFEGDW
jgi:hypothetical protein